MKKPTTIRVSQYVPEMGDFSSKESQIIQQSEQTLKYCMFKGLKRKKPRIHIYICIWYIIWCIWYIHLYIYQRKILEMKNIENMG